MIDAIRKLPPLPQVGGIEPAPRPAAPGGAASQTGGFGEVLERSLGSTQNLNFSQHAQARLLSRQIQLTAPQMERLQHGVDQAAQKGARESLVMVDHLAFIVSVKNRTVVTAVDGGAGNGNVFTQIDSAVIA